MAEDFDIPVEVLSAKEFGELWPNAVIDDLVGAVEGDFAVARRADLLPARVQAAPFYDPGGDRARA